MKYYFYIFLLITGVFTLSTSLYGQSEISNDAEVLEVVSPVANFNYAAEDRVDYVIRIRNNGPNNLIAGDQFRLSYSLANQDTTIAFDTAITVGEPMEVGRVIGYTILEDMTFGSSNNFSACANVNGTNIFPINTNKFPGACSSFIVGIEDLRLAVDQVFYNDGGIHFFINQSGKFDLEIFDMTGKLLLQKTLAGNQEQKINFNDAVKGLYFLKITDQERNTAIKKFIVR